MSEIRTWVFLLLWVGSSTQDKTPDVTVTCFVSEDCFLPCSFPPASKKSIEWLKQEEAVHKFKQEEEDSDSDMDDDDDDDDEEEDDDSSEEQHETRRFSIFPKMLSRGNATLLLRKSVIKDRGIYNCHVNTSKGTHKAKVILKVIAPIRSSTLEMSRLSGYEEMKCTVPNVFPPPHVTWATQPPTFEDLRPVTRMLSNKEGLYTVDSRLKRLKGKPDLIYICKVTSSYGGPAWTTSLRDREITGSQGKDLTIPCFAPPYMNNPFLHWSFSNHEDPSHILTYDSRTGHTVSTPPWESHVELDGFRVPFGDGSLRLMDPKHLEHTGSYTCVFSMPYNTHTDRTDVIIGASAAERSISEMPSYWWIVGVVIAVLVLALLGMLGYLALKGNTSRSRKDPEDLTELRLVKDLRTDSNHHDSSPLTGGSTNGQSGLQTGTQFT